MSGWKARKGRDLAFNITPPTLPVAFFSVLFVVCLCTQPVEANSLINVPLNAKISDFSDETYAFVYRFLNKRALPGITRGSIPLTRGQITDLLSSLSHKHVNGEINLSRIDQEHLTAFLQLFADALPADQISARRRLHVMQLKGDGYHFALDLAVAQETVSRTVDVVSEAGTTYITTLLPHVHGQVRDDFAFSTNIGYNFLYGKRFDDLFPDEALYTHFGGDLENRVPIDAYLKFKLPWFDLQIGQDRLRWGPGYHGALLVSENPTSIDMIKLQGSYKHITFTAFTGVLEELTPGIDDKYISGHRIEGYLWNRFGLGFSELVVYGNRFEPSYLNPVNIYLINMVRTEKGDSRAGKVSGAYGDNVLISFDSRLRLIDNLEIYGELMIDDGNPAKDFHHWDTKFGLLGGLYATDPFGLPDTDLHAEYAFINQYAYTHNNPANVYRHFTSVIGHHIGSDADNLWVELRHRFTDEIESVLTYELERHGEGNVNKPHPPDAPREDLWTPLSGITQSEHRIALGLSYTAIGRYSFVGDLTQIWMRNMGNRLEMNENGQEIKLRALYRF